MRLSQYLTTHFYHTDELCQALNIDADKLEHWQQQSVFPKPSYCIKNQLSCSSYSGLYECEEYDDYYPRGCVNWGQGLIKQKIDSSSQAFNYFAQQYTASLTKLAQQGFEFNEELFGCEIEEHVQQVWQQFLCSKYGVLTQNGLIDEIVAVDIGRLVVDDITELRSKAGLDQDERAKLHPAIKLLNRALSHGADHEKQHTLRTRYIDTLILKYDLSIK
ncbi:DUF6058 family natural product biosynthesis protein (plasmid) [Pseudoalteromonas sp. HL-AS2]|uniref:Orphan protein n=2 Tax=Pseudoalteromonas TaxID=53246 RepID=Q3IC53_PSET1|nr:MULTISPECIES: DUF6058 family natural product biosynthesis protein [Pseudoalteromonas]MBB1405048.1 hypothetical protein [Pseudoalteromonas sp. SG44-5]MBE0420861.1 hypothetical protein [Pseudoalteromonas nigrifaciens]MBH0072076.1 hypothetical protein [Pseudoalteromonas sp. NZS127]MBO7925005.1 hypothetical protein [Pseudoalteromonas sp. K222D]PCC10631.1 hypothetical protein CIK86_18105 [Pseudoalteromonas sp. JB197]